jgi:TolB protein
MRPRLTAAFASTLLLALILVGSAHAAFPGQNGKIAFTRSIAIHVVNPDGSGDTTVADGRRPAWSADGKRLAYVSGNLVVANADGTQATDIDGTFSEDNPAWSPDGARLAYDAIRFFCVPHTCGALPQGIYVINSNGTGDDQVTDPGYDPAWSPDGSKIAFTGYVPEPFGFTTDIFVMNPDGSGITNLTRTHNAYESSPAWSPDGSKLAFTGTDEFGRFADINVMNADGSGVTRLTDDGSIDTQESYPAWSPDGTKIAFQSDRHSSSGATCPCSQSFIVVMDAGGGNQADLVIGGEPDWQPLPAPDRADYKNAAQFCKAERDFLGERQFRQKYGTGPKGANAHGKCVSRR